MLAFLLYFFYAHNYEFILYVIVLLVLATIIAASFEKVKYSYVSLWLLTIWAVLHVAGGAIPTAEGVLYSKMLINIVGEPYNILKYDQLVQMFGFFTATIVMWEVLAPTLLHNVGKHKVRLAIILIAAGMGLGALNEVIEFITRIFDPNNGVGGYVNTSLDLIANLLGASLAYLFIYLQFLKKRQ